jgi:ABC-2 type transport system ATP-binding protein
VEQTCDRVIIIDRGRIIAVDTAHNLRTQLQGAERVFVEVHGPAEEVMSKLKTVPGVMVVSKVADNDGRHRFQIESELHRDVRSEVARLVVESGWGLLELQSATMSLEDIFLKLTTAEEEEKSAAEKV